MKGLDDDADPPRLGTKKAHAFSVAYARCLSDSARPIFTVEYEPHVIMLPKPGDHKETYGRD